jgi:hypothetical protein
MHTRQARLIQKELALTPAKNTTTPNPFTTTVHKGREQSGDRRNAGESNCNSGDGTGQIAKPLMFIIVIIIIIIIIIVIIINVYSYKRKH